MSEAQSKRLAAVQMDVGFMEFQQNLERVLTKIDEVGKLGIDLAIFPECVLTGYCFDSRDEAMPLARAIDDACFSQIAAACESAKTTAVVGFLERDGERLFNAQALVSGGGVIAGYRKIHLPGLGVDRFVDAGDRDFAVQNAAGTRVGMAICYDSSFPETGRVLGLKGADVIALSTNWPSAAERTAEIVPSARSMENHLYFVAANRIGSERGFTFCGMSSITGPDGVLLAKAQGDEETIVAAEVDLSVARNKQIVRTVGKHVIDRFKDRRPQFYAQIVDKS